MSSEQSSDLVELCGLWTNESKNGKKYMSGRLGNARVLIFRNEHKSTDKQPDYRLYLAPIERKTDEGRERQTSEEDTPF